VPQYQNKKYKIGRIGESAALRYLKNNRFTILAHHYTCRWGEIDIVAKKENIIYFIEVKTRTNIYYGQPYEAIDFRKLKVLKRSINYYLAEKRIKDTKLALAVISIILNNRHQVDKIHFYTDVHLLYNLN
jgi:putative endonuclease